MSLKTIWMLRTITMRADGDPGRIARIDAFFGIFSVFGLEHGLRFIKEDAQRTDLPRMGPFYSETSGATLRYVLVNLFFVAPGRYLQTDLCPLMDDRIGQRTMGKDATSATERSSRRRKKRQWNWGRIKIYAFSLICKALLQAEDEEERRELVCALPFPLHCHGI